MTNCLTGRYIDPKGLRLLTGCLYCLFFINSDCSGNKSIHADKNPLLKQVTESAFVADSVKKPKPAVLLIKVFDSEISRPLPSATVVITSLITGDVDRFTALNGRLERTFTASDQLSIAVSAPGYTSIKRKMNIAVSAQGNRYEFDAELDRVAIGLTVWAVDRQTGNIIPGARFTISGKTIGAVSITPTPDSTTGLSKTDLPGKGIYTVSSTAKGYSNFAKSIELDSLQNEAHFILSPKQPLAEVKPLARKETEGGIPAERPVAKPTVTASVATPVVSLSTVAANPFGKLDKGKPVQLNNLYFDQSSPVLRPNSYAELDHLYEALNANPSVRIEIRGHTDNQGDFDLNVKLSRDRCQAVIDYLITKGVSKNRLSAVGRGPIDPVAPNNNEENRKKNRRVEIVVLSNL